MRIEKIGFFKFIDHWVGSPICLLLGLLNRLCHPVYKRYLSIPSEFLPPKTILLIKFFGLGSITLASSLVSNVRRAYKDSKIIFLTFKDNVPILETMALADEILVIDAKNIFVLIGSIVKTVLYCHRRKIDIVMDIEFYSKFSTIMSFLSGAPFRMGFYLARFWRDSLVNVPVYFNPSRHILEIYGMFASAMGIEKPQFYPEGIEIGADKSKKLPRTIGMNIHASDLALVRRWPLSKFVALTQLFLNKYSDWNIILTGTKDETPYSKEFLSLLAPEFKNRVTDLTGQMSLKGFLEKLSQLPLFITNDTGPFHLAKAVDTPTISLWGPGSVDLYGPYGQEKEQHEVIYKRFPCSPCLYVYRTDPGFFCRQKAPCMEAIEPAEVLVLIDQRLKVLIKD